ncbi:MAG: hypothetical protein P8X91_10150 [Candidatus Bathyarchaeota archaeon]
MKKKTIMTLVLIAAFCTITILAVPWGNQIDWPDKVHVDYGFPFVWATQTLSTIVGAVNIWAVDITALTMNLVLWLGIMVICSAVSMLLIKEK